MKLYVISGEASHYVGGGGGNRGSNHHYYWVAAVYQDQALAERHLERISEVEEELFEDMRQGRFEGSNSFAVYSENNKRLKESGLDPNANMDEFSAEYRIDEVNVRNHVPGDPLPLALAGGPNGRLRASELAGCV